MPRRPEYGATEVECQKWNWGPNLEFCGVVRAMGGADTRTPKCWPILLTMPHAMGPEYVLLAICNFGWRRCRPADLFFHSFLLFLFYIQKFRQRTRGRTTCAAKSKEAVRWKDTVPQSRRSGTADPLLIVYAVAFHFVIFFVELSLDLVSVVVRERHIQSR